MPGYYLLTWIRVVHARSDVCAPKMEAQCASAEKNPYLLHESV